MSFIKVDVNSDFSYQNLPYGIFSTADNVSEYFCFLKFLKISPNTLKKF